jgi:hypothetical protein
MLKSTFANALAETGSETTATVPAEHHVLDHMVILNPNNATAYIRLFDTLTNAAAAGPVVDVIPIGPNFAGTIVVSQRFSAAAVITASTSADGTGAPAADLQAALRWARD